jgi:hypothetical protein
VRGPHAKEPSPGYLKSAAASLDLPPEPKPSHAPRRNPSRAAVRARRRRCGNPLPSPLRRQGVAQELRQEVRSTPVLHVAGPEPLLALAPSPEPARRAAASTRRSAALAPEPPP